MTERRTIVLEYSESLERGGTAILFDFNDFITGYPLPFPCNFVTFRLGYEGLADLRKHNCYSQREMLHKIMFLNAST